MKLRARSHTTATILAGALALTSTAALASPVAARSQAGLAARTTTTRHSAAITRTAGGIRAASAMTRDASAGLGCSPQVFCASSPFVTYIYSARYGWIGLEGPSTWDPASKYYPLNTIQILSSDRVWFHQRRNGTGWSHCFWGPGVYQNIAAPYKRPGNVVLSASTARC